MIWLGYELDMVTRRVGIFETKTHLSEMIQQVEAGVRFVITKRGRAVAELRPVEPEKLPLERGCAANRGYWMSPDFDEPLEDLTDYM
jgi:antitoxin (DNA-binding transcriptional repressor) of toxin-antitoxin stability system